MVHKVTVDLPKKHGRADQSALRFSHLQIEKCQNYLREVVELATKNFINSCNSPTSQANDGLYSAASAEFRIELNSYNLQSYHRASSDAISNMNFLKEKFVFGVD